MAAAVKDLITLPDLPQAKVNKCMIALVAKKLVVKENVGVSGVWVALCFESALSSELTHFPAGVDLVQMGRNMKWHRSRIAYLETSPGADEILWQP